MGKLQDVLDAKKEKYADKLAFVTQWAIKSFGEDLDEVKIDFGEKRLIKISLCFGKIALLVNEKLDVLDGQNSVYITSLDLLDEDESLKQILAYYEA